MYCLRNGKSWWGMTWVTDGSLAYHCVWLGRVCTLYAPRNSWVHKEERPDYNLRLQFISFYLSSFQMQNRLMSCLKGEANTEFLKSLQHHLESIGTKFWVEKKSCLCILSQNITSLSLLVFGKANKYITCHMSLNLITR